MSYATNLSKTFIIALLVASMALFVWCSRNASNNTWNNAQNTPNPSAETNTQQGANDTDQSWSQNDGTDSNDKGNNDDAAWEPSPATPEAIAVAQCLWENDVVLYGSDWSRTVNEQKEIFGDSLDYITYVNCQDGDNRRTCIDAGVRWYPTRIDAEWELYVWMQSLEELAEIWNCWQ